MTEADWTAILAQDPGALDAYCDSLLDLGLATRAERARGLEGLAAQIKLAVASTPGVFLLVEQFQSRPYGPEAAWFLAAMGFVEPEAGWNNSTGRWWVLLDIEAASRPMKP